MPDELTLLQAKSLYSSPTLPCVRFTHGMMRLFHSKLHSIALQGWQGVQTIPRSVTYDAELDELLFYPIVEVEQLRQEVLYQDNVTLNQVSHILLLLPVFTPM